MPAFVLVEITIHDHDLYAEYKKLTPPSIDAFGGKFVIRGGKTISMEGDWNPERIVLLEFPNVQLAQEWWDSEQYAQAKEIRQKSAFTKMIIVEGS